MDFLSDLIGNHVFMAAICGWFVAQILKTAIHMWFNRKFVAERLVGSGGMPSSHSATVCALATAAGMEYGGGDECGRQAERVCGTYSPSSADRGAAWYFGGGIHVSLNSEREGVCFRFVWFFYICC